MWTVQEHCSLKDNSIKANTKHWFAWQNLFKETEKKREKPFEQNESLDFSKIFIIV